MSSFSIDSLYSSALSYIGYGGFQGRNVKELFQALSDGFNNNSNQSQHNNDLYKNLIVNDKYIQNKIHKLLINNPQISYYVNLDYDDSKSDSVWTMTNDGLIQSNSEARVIIEKTILTGIGFSDYLAATSRHPSSIEIVASREIRNSLLGWSRELAIYTSNNTNNNNNTKNNSTDETGDPRLYNILELIGRAGIEGITQIEIVNSLHKEKNQAISRFLIIMKTYQLITIEVDRGVNRIWLKHLGPAYRRDPRQATEQDLQNQLAYYHGLKQKRYLKYKTAYKTMLELEQHSKPKKKNEKNNNINAFDEKQNSNLESATDIEILESKESSGNICNNDKEVIDYQDWHFEQEIAGTGYIYNLSIMDQVYRIIHDSGEKGILTTEIRDLLGDFGKQLDRPLQYLQNEYEIVTYADHIKSSQTLRYMTKQNYINKTTGGTARNMFNETAATEKLNTATIPIVAPLTDNYDQRTLAKNNPNSAKNRNRMKSQSTKTEETVESKDSLAEIATTSPPNSAVKSELAESNNNNNNNNTNNISISNSGSKKVDFNSQWTQRIRPLTQLQLNRRNVVLSALAAAPNHILVSWQLSNAIDKSSDSTTSIDRKALKRLLEQMATVDNSIQLINIGLQSNKGVVTIVASKGVDISNPVLREHAVQLANKRSEIASTSMSLATHSKKKKAKRNNNRKSTKKRRKSQDSTSENSESESSTSQSISSSPSSQSSDESSSYSDSNSKRKRKKTPIKSAKTEKSSKTNKKSVTPKKAAVKTSNTEAIDIETKYDEPQTNLPLLPNLISPETSNSSQALFPQENEYSKRDAEDNDNEVTSDSDISSSSKLPGYSSRRAIGPIPKAALRGVFQVYFGFIKPPLARAHLLHYLAWTVYNNSNLMQPTENGDLQFNWEIFVENLQFRHFLQLVPSKYCDYTECPFITDKSIYEVPLKQLPLEYWKTAPATIAATSIWTSIKQDILETLRILEQLKLTKHILSTDSEGKLQAAYALTAQAELVGVNYNMQSVSELENYWKVLGTECVNISFKTRARAAFNSLQQSLLLQYPKSRFNRLYHSKNWVVGPELSLEQKTALDSLSDNGSHYLKSESIIRTAKVCKLNQTLVPAMYFGGKHYDYFNQAADQLALTYTPQPMRLRGSERTSSAMLMHTTKKPKKPEELTNQSSKSTRSTGNRLQNASLTRKTTLRNKNAQLQTSQEEFHDMPPLDQGSPAFISTLPLRRAVSQESVPQLALASAEDEKYDRTQAGADEDDEEDNDDEEEEEESDEDSTNNNNESERTPSKKKGNKGRNRRSRVDKETLYKRIRWNLREDSILIQAYNDWITQYQQITGFIQNIPLLPDNLMETIHHLQIENAEVDREQKSNNNSQQYNIPIGMLSGMQTAVDPYAKQRQLNPDAPAPPPPSLPPLNEFCKARLVKRSTMQVIRRLLWYRKRLKIPLLKLIPGITSENNPIQALQNRAPFQNKNLMDNVFPHPKLNSLLSLIKLILLVPEDKYKQPVAQSLLCVFTDPDTQKLINWLRSDRWITKAKKHLEQTSRGWKMSSLYLDALRDGKTHRDTLKKAATQMKLWLDFKTPDVLFDIESHSEILPERIFNEKVVNLTHQLFNQWILINTQPLINNEREQLTGFRLRVQPNYMPIQLQEAIEYKENRIRVRNQRLLEDELQQQNNNNNNNNNSNSNDNTTTSTSSISNHNNSLDVSSMNIDDTPNNNINNKRKNTEIAAASKRARTNTSTSEIIQVIDDHTENDIDEKDVEMVETTADVFETSDVIELSLQIVTFINNSSVDGISLSQFFQQFPEFSFDGNILNAVINEHSTSLQLALHRCLFRLEVVAVNSYAEKRLISPKYRKFYCIPQVKTEGKLTEEEELEQYHNEQMEKLSKIHSLVKLENEANNDTEADDIEGDSQNTSKAVSHRAYEDILGSGSESSNKEVIELIHYPSAITFSPWRLLDGGINEEKLDMFGHTVLDLIYSKPGINWNQIVTELPSLTPTEIEILLQNLERDSRIRKKTMKLTKPTLFQDEVTDSTVNIYFPTVSALPTY